MINPYKIGGHETRYEYGAVRCCRIWPIVTATVSWDPKWEMYRREPWWWRNCGICGEMPRPIQEDRP